MRRVVSPYVADIIIMFNRTLRRRQPGHRRAFLLKFPSFHMGRWRLLTQSMPEADVRGGSGPSEPGRKCQWRLLEQATSAQSLDCPAGSNQYIFI